MKRVIETTNFIISGVNLIPETEMYNVLRGYLVLLNIDSKRWLFDIVSELYETKDIKKAQKDLTKLLEGI